MKPFIMFTKHLEGYDLNQVIDALQRGGVQGADLCVRPGYPVNPENAAKELPKAAKQFEAAGLSIPLVTTPGDFGDPENPQARILFEACGEAGVQFIKLGYWFVEDDDYWATVDTCRRRLEGFARLSEKTGVRAIVHNHSGLSMGLNSSAVMNLVKGFDPGQIGVYTDVGHLTLVGEPYPLAFNIVKEYMAAVAFKDLIRHRCVENGAIKWIVDVVPFGQGYSDFPVAVDLLKKQGFQGPISFHCEYGRLPPESVVDQCRLDTTHITSLLKN
jgi:sugar phosphate isomerase/epimerase